MEKPGSRTVLVVDDEPDIVFFLKAVLADHGFRVMTAFNGREAADTLRQHPPDLISLDLIMPDESGIRFFHELRKNKEWSKIPVLFVSGHVRETIDGSNLVDLLQDRTLSGPATYLEKPVNAQTYIRTLTTSWAWERMPRNGRRKGRRTSSTRLKRCCPTRLRKLCREFFRCSRRIRREVDRVGRTGGDPPAPWKERRV